jgi:hypothetical protein
VNAFESVIASLLENDGFWVRSSYKVELTPKQKKAIGRPKCPRWELDLVAYCAESNELRIVECKSYLDSPGVTFRDFNETGTYGAARYKLFNDRVLRETVLSQAKAELIKAHACLPDPVVILGLAAGKFRNNDDAKNVAVLFTANQWLLLGPDWIRGRLKRLAASGYDNSVASIVAKLMS